MEAPEQRQRTRPLVGAGSVALLLLLVVPAATTGSSIVPAAATSQQWAYGASGHASGTGTAQRGGTYAMSAYFGWHVVLTQTNTSATTFLVEAQRTMGLWVYVSYCYPSCLAPSYTGNITAHAWETATAFANFTETGSVTVNGSSVRAIALQNVFSQVDANYSENALATLYGPLGHRAADRFLAVSSRANLTSGFTPALGLVPLAPAPGETWSSSSNYSASGEYHLVALNSSTTLVGASSNHAWYRNASANTNGTISLLGTDGGNLVLANGAGVAAILLQTGGPFDEREGFMLLPQGADLFGAGPIGSASGTASTTQVATSRVDFDPRVGGHLGFLASATSFTPASATPTAAASGAALAPMTSPTGGPATTDSPGPSVLQAQPESVPVAQHSASCLVSGCSASSPVVTSRGWLLPLLIAGVLGLVVAAVVVQRRRPVLAPPNPLARLYPVVGADETPVPAAKPPRNGAPVPTSAEDPLDRLW